MRRQVTCLATGRMMRHRFNCSAVSAVTEEQEAKLNKLLRLWESKSNYFETAVIEKMKSPTSSYQEYQNNLIAQHSNAISHLAQQTKSTFEKYVSKCLLRLKLYSVYHLHLPHFQLPKSASSVRNTHYAANTAARNAETRYRTAEQSRQ